MKRNRFTEEQIIGILKEHEAGVSVADLCRKHGVSDANIYKWKAKFGGMDVGGQAAADTGGREHETEAAARGCHCASTRYSPIHAIIDLSRAALAAFDRLGSPAMIRAKEVEW